MARRTSPVVREANKRRAIPTHTLGSSLGGSLKWRATSQWFTRTMKPLAAVAVVVSAMALSACDGSAKTSAIVRSTDCRVVVTNPDLAGCDLAHRNLSGQDLQADNLRGADLTGVNLDGANIQGVRLKGAVTTGVHTNARTVCVNAEYGPCSKPGLRSPRTTNAAQGH